MEKPEDIDTMKMFKGYSLAFKECENGIYLRVDPTRCLVNKIIVMELIDKIRRIYLEHQDIRRKVMKNALIGSIVRTTYGKGLLYRVVDIEFIFMKDVAISS